MPKNDYSLWNPDVYMETYFGKQYLTDDSQPDGVIHFLLNSLSDVYSGGQIKGQTLLDLGTGPTIYNLISAAQHFQNIYVSDFVECNRDALWRWIDKDPKAIDHSHLFSYVNKKEKSSLACEDRQDDLRSRIRGVLACDVTFENPLFPSIFPQFDVISTSACLSVAPKATVEEYETAVKNVSSLLKPDGWLVYIDSLKGQYYTVGDHKFWFMSLTKEIVTTAVEKAGLGVESWTEYSFKPEEIDDSDDSGGMFCLTARKHIS